MFVGCELAVLSGAGISAESGVPTFTMTKKNSCGPDSTLTSCPARKAGCQPGGSGMVPMKAVSGGNVEPNDGHRAIAAWQDHAEVSVITQNVDDLHERAGGGAVHHLHGGARISLHVVVCPTPTPFRRCPSLRSEVEPPVCDCGGLIGRHRMVR